MKFEVKATDQATGEQRWLVLECHGETDLRRECEERGLAVDAVREVQTPRPTPWTIRDGASVTAAVLLLALAFAGALGSGTSPTLAVQEYQKAHKRLKAARIDDGVRGSGVTGYTLSYAGGGADGPLYRVDPITGSSRLTKDELSAQLDRAKSDASAARWKMIKSYAAPTAAVGGLLGALWLFFDVLSRHRRAAST